MCLVVLVVSDISLPCWRFDDQHRMEFVNNEQQHHRVAELDLNSQYVANELKRMRQDYDAAIATTTSGIQKWNDTVRRSRRNLTERASRTPKLEVASQV